MQSICLLIEKRDGTIKAREVADGSSQRRRPGYKKEDSASPTVATESIFITGAIEAHEGRKVNRYDIPGAYLHAECKEGHQYMRLDGQLAELMVLVDPKLYRKHVRYSTKGEAVLYVRIAKALYGMLKSALWWYKELRKRLKEFRFKVNP